jgi:hypothetical protein
MAQYTIEIEDALFSQITEAFATVYNYSATVKTDDGEIENPKSKIDFLRECTANYWKDVLMGHLRNQAQAQVNQSLKDIQVAMTAKQA